MGDTEVRMTIHYERKLSSLLNESLLCEPIGWPRMLVKTVSCLPRLLQ